MAAAGTFPDAWNEFYQVNIIRTTGIGVAFQGLTEELSFDFADKDIESIELANAGRVVKRIPMTDESVTMKVYPVDAKLTGDGVVQWFHPQSTDDATQPIAVDNTFARNKHRLVFLWAETLPASAVTQPAISKTAYRIQVVNAYMTSYKLNYDDKLMSAEITFKWAPLNKSASPNKREESTDGTAQLAAVGTTTTDMDT